MEEAYVPAQKVIVAICNRILGVHHDLLSSYFFESFIGQAKSSESANVIIINENEKVPRISDQPSAMVS